jgi:hypothetical protein
MGPDPNLVVTDMTSPDDAAAIRERHRLLTAPSIAGVVTSHVEDLVELGAEDVPEWVTRLGVPPRWCLARIEDGPIQPARITVCGQNPDYGWDGCETITAFRFTGTPPVNIVYDNADCTLRGLNGEDITTSVLVTQQQTTGAVAVRATGYFTAAQRRIWAQHSTYLTGSESPGAGLLIEHNIFAVSDRRASLSDDITQLGNTIHRAFVNTIEARPGQHKPTISGSTNTYNLPPRKRPK